MHNYCFFQKGEQIIALEVTNTARALQLTDEGFKNSLKKSAPAMKKPPLHAWPISVEIIK